MTREELDFNLCFWAPRPAVYMYIVTVLQGRRNRTSRPASRQTNNVANMHFIINLNSVSTREKTAITNLSCHKADDHSTDFVLVYEFGVSALLLVLEIQSSQAIT